MALAVLVAFCINYSNNLGIAFICLLSVIYLGSIFRNYAVLKKLEVVSVHHTPHDEEQNGVLVISFRFLRKKSKAPLPLIWVTIERQDLPVMFNEEGLGHVHWEFSHKAGVHELPKIVVFTLWPHSITRSWTDLKIAQAVAVVPGASQALVRGAGEGAQDVSGLHMVDREGDVEGIRDVGMYETPSKISWKHTIKHNKLMTYTWEKPQKNAVVIHWPEGHQSALEKSFWMRARIDEAVAANKVFQIVHPQFISNYGRGEAFGVSMLSSLMMRVVPPTPWESKA